MALIYCNQCGKQVSDRAQCCPHCGAPVADHSENADNQYSTKSDTGPRAIRIDDKAPSNKNKWIIAAVAAMITIMLAAGIWWAHNRSSHPDIAQEAIDTLTRVEDDMPDIWIDAHEGNGTFDLRGEIAGVSVKGILYRDGERLYGIYGYKGRSDGVFFYGIIRGKDSSQQNASGSSLSGYAEEAIDTIPISFYFWEYDYEVKQITGTFSDGTLGDQTSNGQMLSGRFVNSHNSAYQATFYLKYRNSDSAPAHVKAYIHEMEETMGIVSLPEGLEKLVSSNDNDMDYYNDTVAVDTAAPAANAYTPSSGNWKYQTRTDPLDDAVSYLAVVQSDNKASVCDEKTYLYLGLCRNTYGNYVMLHVERGMLRQDRLPMAHVRFDGGEVEMWSVRPDGEQTHHIVGADEFIQKLKKSKKCAVRIETQDGSSATFTFNTRGLVWNH